MEAREQQVGQGVCLLPQFNTVNVCKIVFYKLPCGCCRLFLTFDFDQPNAKGTSLGEGA